MSTKTKKAKFVAVPLMALTLLASGLGFPANSLNAFGGVGEVSTVADPVNGLSTANGFPLWYEDVTGGGGNRLQLCLGQNPDGTGIADPKCIPPTVSPIGAVTPTTFPDESFYWFAEAPLIVNGQDARFRMTLEAAFAGAGAAVDGQQIVFARASLFTSQDAVFTPGDYTVTYPFGSFTFTVDALGAMTQPNVTAPFQPNGGGAKEMRAEDGPGLAGDFTAVLAGTNTGIVNVFGNTSATPGYLGDGVTEAPSAGNTVSIAGPSTITGGTNWIVAGKLMPSAVVYTTQPSTTATATVALPTQPVVALQGNAVTLPTATQNVTLAAFTDSACTIAGPALTGTTTRAAVAGVATFTDIAVSQPGTFFIGATSPTIPTQCAAAATVVGPVVPTAAADTLSTVVDTPLTVPATQLLANDAVGSNGPISIVSVQSATNGTVVLNPDDTITFTPTPGFIGTASFTYTINDTSVPVEVSVATVTVNVTPPLTPIYRLYNTVTGAHVYTRGEAERAFIMNKFPAFEFTDGIPAFNASLTASTGLTPIYRLYNTQTGVHLYTRGETDRDFVLNKFPAFEFTDGVPAFYASLDAQAGLTPIYRLFNTVTGVHLYTRGDVDRDFVLNKFPAFEFTDGRPAFYAKVN